MRSWRQWLAGTLALTMMLAAACDDNGGDEEDDDPAADSTATASAEGTFVPAPDPVSYPLTLTDMLGRSVRIDEKPERIAAMSATTVEFVYALGAESVTRASSVVYPDAAQDAADVGPVDAPDLELIEEQDPHIIIADSVLQPQLLEQFESLGVPVVYAGALSFAEVLTAFGVIGEAIDRVAEAEEGRASTLNMLTVITTRLPGYQHRVIGARGTPGDFLVATPQSYLGDLVRLLAGENMAAGEPDAAGYAVMAVDDMIGTAPTTVLAITTERADSQTITEVLAADPAWAEVPAVVNNRLFEIDDAIFFEAPGPRAKEAVDVLSKLLYPEVFGP